MSIALACLEFTGLYEAELLTELMLRYWRHPLAENDEFRAVVLDQAASILRDAVAGNACVETLSPENTNFVVAVWCAEQESWIDEQDALLSDPDERQRWRDDLRRSIPGCFVDPEMLD